MKKTLTLMLLLSSPTTFSGPLSAALTYIATKTACYGVIQASYSDSARSATMATHLSTSHSLDKEIILPGSAKAAKAINSTGLAPTATKVTDTIASSVGTAGLLVAAEGTPAAVAVAVLFSPLP